MKVKMTLVILSSSVQVIIDTSQLQDVATNFFSSSYNVTVCTVDHDRVEQSGHPDLVCAMLLVKLLLYPLYCELPFRI